MAGTRWAAAALVAAAGLWGCGGGDGIGVGPGTVARAGPAGTQLRIDQYVTQLRRGEVLTATVVEAAGRIEGQSVTGPYWVDLSGSGPAVENRIVSAIEDAGVPLAVQPARPYQGPGTALRVDQFITLLRQGRVATATVVRAERRIVGTYDRGEYWVAFTPELLARLASALQNAGVPLHEG